MKLNVKYLLGILGAAAVLSFGAILHSTALARAVAVRVIEYRVEHGISQTELGRRLGMHQPAIARLEEGERNPSIDMLRRLSEKLGIDFNISIHLGSLEVEGSTKASA